MRIRDRLRRAWRWARVQLASPPPARRASPSPVSSSATKPAQPPRSGGRDTPSDAVVVGGVTLRLWPVGNLVVLASSDGEAEDALVSLLAHPDLAVRTAAAARLDQLRGARAAAA